MKRLFILVASVFVLVSCDGGLTLPPDTEPGIAGTITVTSAWPPPDSVKSLLLFASQIFPLDSSKVFSGIIDGKIIVYPSATGTLPYNVNVQTFNAPLPAAPYFYIGVLQRHGVDLFDPKSYRVVGVLKDEQNPSLPKTVTVHDFEVVANLAIQVDFYNLPPQPF